jgi:acetylcholinesterase
VGGSSDPRFNGSWIVEKSVEMGKPIVRGFAPGTARMTERKCTQIFASFNYRLTAFGFLYSKEVRAEKMGNFGLFDQVCL